MPLRDLQHINRAPLNETESVTPIIKHLDLKKENSHKVNSFTRQRGRKQDVSKEKDDKQRGPAGSLDSLA